MFRSGKDRESQLLMEGSQAGYYSRIEDAGWLRHCRLLLMAGVIGAEKLHFEGTSVLVHCSDGWCDLPAFYFIMCLFIILLFVSLFFSYV